MRTNPMTWAVAAAGALAWSGPALAQDGMPEEQGAGVDAQQESTGASQTEAGQAGQQGRIDGDIQESLQKLHATNQAEIELGKKAATQAQSTEVKQFARKMVQEHQQGDQKLRQAAQRLGVQLQGEKYQEALQEHRDRTQGLEQQQGAEFDRAFMAQMVRAHGDALEEVHETATKAGEQGSTQLAQVLGQTEAALHGHHAEAQQIQQKLQQQARSQQSGTGAGDQPMDPTGAAEPQGGLDVPQPAPERQQEQQAE